MKRGILFAFLVLAIQSTTRAQNPMDVPDLKRFDGKTFGLIELGVSTDDQIKKIYKTSRGAVRPEALKLETAGNTPFRVNVLLDGRGKTAKAIAVRVDIKNEDLDASDFFLAYGDSWLMGYLETRYEDWGIAIHSELGIIAVVHELSRKPVVATLFFVTPRVASEISRRISKTKSEILAYEDPYRELDILAEVSGVTAYVTAKGVDLKDERDVVYDMERRTERLAERGRLIRFSRKAKAEMRVSASVDYSNSKGGNISATLSLDIETQFGSIGVSGSGSEALKKGSGSPRWFDAVPFMDAIEDAYDVLIDALKKEYRRLIPANGEVATRQSLEKLWNDAIR